MEVATRRNPTLVTAVIMTMLAALIPLGMATPASGATGDPVLINEILASHSGSDDAEFIELYGTPGTALAGLSLIVVEGDAFGPGSIDRQFDFKPFHEIGSNGFFLLGNCGGLPAEFGATPDASIFTNYLENSSATYALVATSSITGGSVAGTEVVRDAVALTDGDAGDTFYFGAPVLGPDGTFFPAGVRRLIDGADTDTAADWEFADFLLPGANTPTGGGFDGCAPIELTIPEIQGSGQVSDYAGEVAITTGVVTAISTNGRDGFIQDPVGDGDPATSDGIFVDDFDDLTGVQVGDSITIEGTVEEQQFGNELPLTRINNPTLVSVTSTGNALPPAVEIRDMPDTSVADAIEYLESLEGMRVMVRNASVVAATNRFGEFAMLANRDAKPGSGYYPQAKQIILQSVGVNLVDYNPERLLVDDLTLDDAIVVRPGDKVKYLAGPLDYTFGNYKIQPTEYDVVRVPLESAEPISTRSGPKGNTVITSYNVENLFDLVLSSQADVIGQVGFDPGAEWSEAGIGTQNQTLRRKDTVCSGDPDGSDPFDPSAEWDGYERDDFTGLGTHAVTCGSATGLFISEYVEGSSLNKAIEIYNGTGDVVDLAASNARIDVYFNGSNSAGTTIALTGTVSSGDVYVVADDGADAAILAVADQTTTSSLFNGDDAVVLSVGGKDDASSTPAPEELETQLTKLALAIEIELQLPEIMVLQEVENTAIAQQLGDRVNSANGTDYVAVSFETSDARGIEVAFLFDDDRVDLIEAYQLTGSDVVAAFGPSSPSPGREPLYGKFIVGDDVIHIVGNHFKSKGGDDPIFGIGFERITEVQRKAQAQVVADFVEGLLDSDPDAMIMVTGDLNDFQFGEPGEGGDHPVAILEGAGEGFTNLVDMEKPAERWTFVFDGNSQVLDHMLVNDALLKKLAGTDILHFNAGYPAAFGADASTPVRASDHDAVEGRFNLG